MLGPSEGRLAAAVGLAKGPEEESLLAEVFAVLVLGRAKHFPKGLDSSIRR